jgi:ketosteroid isomerase-like protein|tara:strand:+ start:2313 stop:2663 length:351 start_codon:yes stop_codon:yes gene_type:complete
MTTRGQKLIDQYYATMAAGDVEALAAFYSLDALVIRFDGTSTGIAEILEFFTKMHAHYGQYELQSLDQVTESGDVLMWDALVTTSNGVVQVTEVLVLDEDGKIRRHMPGFRGFWGK